MKNKKSILIGMLLIGFSILIAFIGYQRVKERKMDEKKTMQMVIKEEINEEKKEEVTVFFEVTGLSKDVYQMLGETEENLATFLQEWTYYNGFSRAKSASFYPEIVYNANEKIFLLECQLDDEDETILTIKYEQQRKNWEAHL